MEGYTSKWEEREKMRDKVSQRGHRTTTGGGSSFDNDILRENLECVTF